jgi:hypothetical protein
MQVKNYGQSVRRIHSGFELICEEEIGGEWVRFFVTNEMSNDYAYSETDRACAQKVNERSLAVA